MSAHDNGGPAFPFGVQVRLRDGYGGGERTVEENECGMTLRDYFAAEVLNAAFFSASGLGSLSKEQLDAQLAGVSRIAYMAADAMLKERAK